MNASLTRRRFLALGSLGLPVSAGMLRSAPRAAAPAGVSDLFPAHPPELVREMLAVSHGNLARVREIVDARPSLARAAWDWGYGDWETALGAASHVGNRPIAELLLENGAPPTIFSAVMLGQLDIVKTFIAASPGLQRLRGPHGLTMMVHARMGGAPAAAVVKYLESLGDAALPYRDDPIPADERAALEGRYTFGDRPRDSFVVRIDKNQLWINRPGATDRPLYHQGEFAF